MKVGIDLGTTYSVISKVNEQGIPTLFPDFHDPNIHRTPSVVHIGERGCFVGEILEDLLEDDPSLPVARFAKLEMGKGTPVYKDHKGIDWKPEEISAMILRKVVQDAQAVASESVSGVVITVPAQFGDAERRATKDAGNLAGIQNVIIVDEPIAAAHYYGQAEREKDSTLMVYDLGGGTFDATILQAAPEGLFVLATDGERVGGKDFDDEIIKVAAESFKAMHGVDPLEDPVAAIQLRRFAEISKIKLSQPARGQISSSLLISGKPLEFIMTRSQFEGLIEGYLKKTIEVCERCLADAALSWDDMDVILLTGGSSRLPIVRVMVTQQSGKPADAIKVDKPDMAVSYGAALMAQNILADEEQADDMTYQQVASHDLAIRVVDPETNEPALQVIIKKNSPLPASRDLNCFTWRDDQRQLDFEFIQMRGNRQLSLGSFAFGPISKPRKGYPISLSVSYNREGMVEVSAKDLETGEEMERVIEDLERANWVSLDKQRQRIQAIPVNE